LNFFRLNIHKGAEHRLYL